MLFLKSKDNINIKNAVKLKKSAKYRRETGYFTAEGVRLCMDALYSNAVIDTFFVTENALKKYSCEYNKLSEYADKTFVVSPSLFLSISDTDTPQGFLCIIKVLDKTSQFDTIKNSDKFLALDNLQDPNNLGTLLRTAEAFKDSALPFIGIVTQLEHFSIVSDFKPLPSFPTATTHGEIKSISVTLSASGDTTAA